MACSGTNWTELIAGFVLGLIGGLVVERIQDFVRGRRLKAALVAELRRIRSQCLGVQWAVAEAHGKLTPALAAAMYALLQNDELAKKKFTAKRIEITKEMSESQQACDRENRALTEGGLFVPPSLTSPVFTGQSEVLGRLSQRAARSVVDAYYAIPGINGICDALQRYSYERPALADVEQRRRDAQLAAEQELLIGLLSDLQWRCEDAIRHVSGEDPQVWPS